MTVYLIIVLLSCGLLLGMAALLLFGHIPHGFQMKKYRLSCIFLAAAYIIMAVSAIYKISIDEADRDLFLLQSITLAVASFESLLFTFSLLTIISPTVVTLRRTLIYLTVPIGVSLLLLLGGKIGFYVSVGIYILQLVWYPILFERGYRQSIASIDEYYAEDEDTRMRWVRKLFYMALSYGVLTIFSTFFNILGYTIYMVICVCFYTLFAIKYRDYVTLFTYLSTPAIAKGLPLQMTSVDGVSRESILENAVEKWVEQKKYILRGVSLDDIARSLGTNRTYLSQYINATKGLSFKIWRTTLRVEEAKRLLIEKPDLSTADIGFLSGFEDPSNFNHCFKSITGLSPRQWQRSFS